MTVYAHARPSITCNLRGMDDRAASDELRRLGEYAEHGTRVELHIRRGQLLPTTGLDYLRHHGRDLDIKVVGHDTPTVNKWCAYLNGDRGRLPRGY